MPLSERIRAYLAKIPGAISGSGGHNQTFTVACILLHGWRLSDSEAFSYLLEYNQRCVPPWSEHELRHKLASANGTPPSKPIGHLLNGADVPAGSSLPAPKPKPQPSLAAIESVAAKHRGGLTDIWESSPLPLAVNDPQTESLIDLLFPGNPLLCCGKSAREFDTRPRDGWRGELEKQAFIVPSPMSKPTGLTKDGKESAHTLDNTGPRRFLVVECDFSEYKHDGITETIYAPLIRRLLLEGVEIIDLCASILIYLSSLAPLVMAVHSGGKSLHGWFWAADVDDGKLKRFFDHAFILGADRATWGRQQFVRMPDGLRDNGKRQPVYYFNAKAIRP